MQKAIADHGLGNRHRRANISQAVVIPVRDVNAVFFRAALLQHLFQSGLLDDWREGSEPATLVYPSRRRFPMELGVRGFDPADFMKRLRSEEP